VAIPPLRERRADIAPLLRRYVGFFAEVLGRDVHGLDAAAEAAALRHPWPGNVRELRNRAERGVALAAGPLIGASDLFADTPEGGAERAAPTGGLPHLAAVRDEAERRHIRAALAATDGQIQRAAEVLGISRTTLWEKMRRLGLAGEPPA
jgi:DNA-binding NtrC family response regulator